MSKRSRNDDNENEQVKKFFSTNSEYNVNSNSNKEDDNQMDICYDSNSDDSIITDVSNSSARVVVVKESHSSEILSLDFYPGLHRHITNKIGW